MRIRSYTMCLVILLTGLFMGSAIWPHTEKSVATTERALNKNADDFQDFPAMCVSGADDVFVSYINRPVGENPELVVATWDQDHGLHTLATIGSADITAFDAPALAASEEGCLLVFSAEIRGQWQIGYLPITTGKNVAKPRFLNCKGTVNAKPAVAASGDTFCLVWESNAGKTRQIYGSFLSGGKVGPPVALSPVGIPAGNPALTATGSGNAFFVAWDAFAVDNSDIYGRACVGGKWQKIERLTDDPRVERHVSVAAAPDGKVWLAWEANTLKSAHNGHLLVNRYLDQNIVVAERTANGLKMPADIFGAKGPQADGKPCKRPVVAVDSAGRLHLSFRKTAATYKGKTIEVGSFWKVEVWTYAGNSWFGPTPHGHDWGWWRPVPLAMHGENRLYVAIQEGIGLSYELAEKSASSVVLEELEISAPAQKAQTTELLMPETDFNLGAYLAKYSLRLPRQTLNHDGRKLNLYWGDMHEHTAMSQCDRVSNPPARDLFGNQRDIDQMDFTALTDHGYNHCSRTWAYTREQVRVNFDPDRFVSLLGIEWTSESFGHHNLIFEDTNVDTIYHRHFQGKSPVELYDYIEGKESGDFIGIPHGLADCSPITMPRQADWSQVHELHQPIAEIFQARQSYEHQGCPRESHTAKALPWMSRGFYLWDAWQDEVIIGTSASPDHGGTQGRTGVWAGDLSPESLFDAFHKRHTFGTSGAKIVLYFASGGDLMGDKVQRRPSSKPISFDVKVITGKPISRVIIFRNNKKVHEITSPGNEVETTWTDSAPPVADRLWYYVRVERADGELAWSSPIWFLSPEEMKRPPTHTMAKPRQDILAERLFEQNAKKAEAFKVGKMAVEVTTGFEGTADLPRGWFKKKDDITKVEIDAKNRCSGKQSLLIESKRNMPKYSWPGATYAIRVPPAPKGKNLQWLLSYHIKTDCEGVGAYAVIEYLDENGKRISYVSGLHITGKMGWKNYLMIETVAKGAKTINISLQLHGGGKAWFDDVEFRLK